MWHRSYVWKHCWCMVIAARRAHCTMRPCLHIASLFLLPSLLSPYSCGLIAYGAMHVMYTQPRNTCIRIRSRALVCTYIYAAQMRTPLTADKREWKKKRPLWTKQILKLTENIKNSLFLPRLQFSIKLYSPLSHIAIAQHKLLNN